MSGEVALIASFGPAEARRLTDEIKRDAQALWRKLVELYEGGAHTALGYSSWADYCAAEFEIGKSRSYQLLDAGRVVQAIPQTVEREPGPRATAERAGRDVGPLISEAQARELAPVLRKQGPDAVAQTWRRITDEHGSDVAADVIREDVRGSSPEQLETAARKKVWHKLLSLQEVCDELPGPLNIGRALAVASESDISKWLRITDEAAATISALGDRLRRAHD